MIETERAAEAESLLQEALEIRKNAFDEEDWRIAQVEAHLGRSLLYQHRLEEAEYLLHKSQASLLAKLGNNDLHTIRVQEDLKTLSAMRN